MRDNDRDRPISITQGEFRAWLAASCGLDVDKIAVYAVAIGLSGTHQAAVIPWMADEDAPDTATTIRLFAQAIENLTEDLM
jgi:hypothetical protein